ncbi:MAG: hypothetical protein ABEI97_05420 [Candidatus Nanohaloarchaea archaeon]
MTTEEETHRPDRRFTAYDTVLVTGENRYLGPLTVFDDSIDGEQYDAGMDGLPGTYWVTFTEDAQHQIQEKTREFADTLEGAAPQAAVAGYCAGGYAVLNALEDADDPGAFGSTVDPVIAFQPPSGITSPDGDPHRLDRIDAPDDTGVYVIYAETTPDSQRVDGDYTQVTIRGPEHEYDFDRPTREQMRIRSQIHQFKPTRSEAEQVVDHILDGTPSKIPEIDRVDVSHWAPDTP